MQKVMSKTVNSHNNRKVVKKKKIKFKYSDIIINMFISFLFTLSVTWNANESFSFLNFFVFFIFTFMLFYFIWNKIDNIKINNLKKKISKKEFLIFGIIILIPMIFMIIAYYPGYVWVDSVIQFNQAQNNVYSNWHPVLLTLFLFKLPTMIYNKVISITIFQNLIIFGILLYFCYFLRKNFLTFKQTIIVLLLFVLNPLIMRYNINLVKDILYSWVIFLTTLYVINIVITDGNWIKNNWNKVAFIISSFCILAFRHNGIVPFILLYIGLFLFYSRSRKFFGISLICILGIFFLITGPVYKYFKIDANTGGKPEMVGIIMGQISYYYHNQGITNPEDINLLTKICPESVWNDYYSPTSFNTIKWKSSYYSSAVNSYFKEYINLWLSTSINHPAMFLKSYINMTSPIWKTEKNIYEVYGGEYNNETEISSKGDLKKISDSFLKEFELYVNNINNSPLRWLFFNIGESLIIMLWSLLVVLKRSKWNFKAIMPYTIVLFNTCVIMCLITGEEERFIYSQALCLIPLLIYSFSSYISDSLVKEINNSNNNKRKENKNEKTNSK